MPVFNSAKYIREALASVQNQYFRDFELIIIDDGSTDGSSDILRTLAREDSRIRLIQRSNHGLIATRNELLREAKGEFLAWMDSDDISLPDRLRRQVGIFDSDPSLICVGTNVQLIDAVGRPLGVESYPQGDEAIRAEQVRGGGLRFASTMQRRAIAILSGGFRPPFPMGEDFDYLLRVGERGRMANVPDVLYVYRQHLLSTCTTYGRNWPRFREIILDLAEQRREQGYDKLQRGEGITLPPVQDEDALRFVPLVLHEWAKGALSTGDRFRAIRYTLTAIWVSPFDGTAWRFLTKLLLLRV